MVALGLRAETNPEANSSPSVAVPHVMSVVRVDPHSGKLIRSMALSAKPDNKLRSATPEVQSLVEKTARDFDVNPALVDSVIQVESNYDQFAVSPKGARGLMQLMPETARRFGVTNTFDPKQNVEGGVRYLKFLQDTFQDDRLAIAAYNAGEKAVTRYGNVPPYAETVSYVAKVGQKYRKASQTAQKSRAQSKTEDPAKDQTPAAPAASAEPETHHIVASRDAEGRLYIATR